MVKEFVSPRRTAADDAGFMLTNLAEVGEYIEQDEEIATIETDKV